MRTTRLSQVALVTGAASGIGRALVHALARRGDAIVAADIDAEGLRRTIDEIHASSAKIIAVHVDVSDVEDIERLAKTAFDAAERVHLLINNAGMLVSGNCWATAVADWKRTLDVNLWSVIHSARSFVPRMLHRGGHIVNVSSMAGWTPGPDLAAYRSPSTGSWRIASVWLQNSPLKVPQSKCQWSARVPSRLASQMLYRSMTALSRGSRIRTLLSSSSYWTAWPPRCSLSSCFQMSTPGNSGSFPIRMVYAAVEQRAKEILHSSTRTSF